MNKYIFTLSAKSKYATNTSVVIYAESITAAAELLTEEEKTRVIYITE